MTGEYPVRHLRLVIGTDDYVTKHSNGIALLPQDFALEQNYPNPFNPVTTITYALSETAHVRLFVYDMLGCEVSRLADSMQSAGQYEVLFDAGDLPSTAR